jgi:drug/metabolite transporter (DMT)-like permease
VRWLVVAIALFALGAALVYTPGGALSEPFENLYGQGSGPGELRDARCDPESVGWAALALAVAAVAAAVAAALAAARRRSRPWVVGSVVASMASLALTLGSGYCGVTELL